MAATLNFVNTTSSIIPIPQEPYGNPADYVGSNLYWNVTNTQNGYKQTLTGYTGTVTVAESGVTIPNYTQLQFNEFNTTSPTTIEFVNAYTESVYVIYNTLNNGTINYQLTGVTIEATNGTPITGALILIGV